MSRGGTGFAPAHDMSRRRAHLVSAKATLPLEAARSAGLRYVTDDKPGIRRTIRR